jgi:hypothetical protein
VALGAPLRSSPERELQVNEGVVVHRLVVFDVVKDADSDRIPRSLAPRLGLDIHFQAAHFVVVRRAID